MPKHQSVIGDPSALMALMAHNINEALSAHPDKFRAGRGRNADFVERYGMMRTVAHRLLTGEAFPSHTLLNEMSQDLGIPIGFFYGKEPLPAHMTNPSSAQIPIYGAMGFYVSLPPQMLPEQSADGLKLVRVSSLEFRPYTNIGDYVMVKRVDSFGDSKAAHVCLSSDAGGKIFVASFAAGLRSSDPVVVRTSEGKESSFSASEVSFDEASPAPLTILGKIVGRVAFDGNGLPLTAMATE